MSPASLANALGDVGFAVVLECRLPAAPYATEENRTYVALARDEVDVVAVPTFAGDPKFRLDDRRAPWAARAMAKVRPVVGRAVPAPLRPRLRRIVSRVVGTH